jgi:hypothetical protein
MVWLVLLHRPPEAAHQDGESPCRRKRWDVHFLGNLVIETGGYLAQSIPLIRRTIFFYDLAGVVVPNVAGDLHHASSSDKWKKF